MTQSLLCLTTLCITSCIASTVCRKSFPETSSRDLLLTLVDKVDTPPWYIWTFVKSFRAWNQKATIVVMIPPGLKQNKNLQFIASTENVHFHTFAESNITRSFHATSYRFFFWAKFLYKNKNDYDRVITSDCGDVYFQEDPFTRCNAFQNSHSCTLSMFFEDERYIMGLDRNNEFCSDHASAKMLSKYPLINAGFLTGTVTGFLRFFEFYKWKLSKILVYPCPRTLTLRF